MRKAANALLPVALVGIALGAGCGSIGSSGHARAVPGGSADRGADLINSYGCGACHTIGGIDGANGQVGPALNNLSGRIYIAGRLPNNPRNLIRWIRYPQQIYPGNVMPDLGISDHDARDIAAYLYQH
jgi:cytochrome c2